MSSARPVTSEADHSGRSGGRRWATRSAATAKSALRSPGIVQRTSFTWLAMSNEASSTQIGLPHPSGSGHSRWRSLGTPAMRSASVDRTTSRSRGRTDANTRTAPTWPAAGVVAVASSIMSMALARSMGPDAMRAPFSVRFTETLGTVPGGKTDATDTASRSPRWRNTNRQYGAPSYGLNARVVGRCRDGRAVGRGGGPAEWPRLRRRDLWRHWQP